MSKPLTRGAAALRRYLNGPPKRSQSWLADQLGIEQPSVSNWLNGQSRPEPHHRTALRLIAGVMEDLWLTADERAVIRRAADVATGTEG
jgi:transcriptional regulator with XRE-family HTH domain